ncbi:hypothetical protein H1R20_g9839, partial [Candolleomyces eurysporus]
MDLYVGYDERVLDERSRDLTTFQTPFGAMRLVTLPMGWTNSVPIFHEDITAILQPEIPHITEPFVDDVPVKGLLTRAEPIQKLTRKSVRWEWGEEQDKTMADLKKAVEEAPVLKPLDVTSGQPVRLSVDTSYLAVGWYISQRDAIDPNKWNYIRFGSTLLNSTEANYSQAKRELYGIMRALKENEYTLVMARPLVVETDAKYVQGMLQNPGAAPNATINRWIENVRKFYFELSHVMGKTFPADGLSRWRKHPGDPERREFEEFLDTDPPDPITYSKKFPEDDDPLPFEAFKDQIDTRGGYLQTVSRDIVYHLLFQGVEEEEDLFSRDLEFQQLLNRLEETKRLSIESEAVSVLLQAASQERWWTRWGRTTQPAGKQAEGGSLTSGFPLVQAWLSTPAVKPREVAAKDWKGFERFAARFFVSKDGRLYWQENAHGAQECPQAEKAAN